VMRKSARHEAERAFGEIVGIHPGHRFRRRSDLRAAGVHMQPGRGIDSSRFGARAIVFSGGYVDDVWESENPIYTGEGGRDQRGRQVQDQIMVAGNLALRKNMVMHIPVRVVRKIEAGADFYYRYEGLYDIIRVRFESSRDGPKVYKFDLKQRL
jgi:SAD/SRA domain